MKDPPEQFAFDGFTYEPTLDHARLRGQLLRVYMLMSDGRWRTLKQIVRTTGGTEAAISARLRDFRKPKYGARIVDRVRISGGLFKYRLRIRVEVPEVQYQLQIEPEATNR